MESWNRANLIQFSCTLHLPRPWAVCRASSLVVIEVKELFNRWMSKREKKILDVNETILSHRIGSVNPP